MGTALTFTWPGLIKELVVLVLINSIIAFTLQGIGFAEALGVSLIYSQLIGFSIYTWVRGSYGFFNKFSPIGQLIIIFLALTMGAITGMGLTHLFLPEETRLTFSLNDHRFLWQVLLVSLCCGTMVSYLYISQKKIQEIKALAQEEKIRRLAREKQAVELELKLLQAQVEPHFLFNTLAHIHCLLTTDRESAGRMLLNLTGYLRTSLARSRLASITIKDELTLIEAYLELMKIRMGSRLTYGIELTDEIGEEEIPPMLLQPLIENSIKHGLEPMVEGGSITLHIGRQESMLRIEITDTGQGLSEKNHPGFGTSSVFRRIHGIYGIDMTQIRFERNIPQGLKVIMTLPRFIPKDHPQGVQ